MTDFDSRLRALVDDHQRMQDEYAQLRDAGHEVDLANPQPIWQQWYERFLEIKDRMYQLAHDLEIPFESGEHTAEDYAQVWEQVQARLGIDGNRRAGGGQ